MGTIGIFSKVTPKRNNHPSEENNIIISTDVSQTDPSVKTTNIVSEPATSGVTNIATSETMNSDNTSAKESIQINQTEAVKASSEQTTNVTQSQTSAKTNVTNRQHHLITKTSCITVNLPETQEHLYLTDMKVRLLHLVI